MPPKVTAGLARSRVRGYSRSPAPPASKTPRVSLIYCDFPSAKFPCRGKTHLYRRSATPGACRPVLERRNLSTLRATQRVADRVGTSAFVVDGNAKRPQEL